MMGILKIKFRYAEILKRKCFDADDPENAMFDVEILKIQRYDAENTENAMSDAENPENKKG